MKIKCLLALMAAGLLFAGGCASTQEQSVQSLQEVPTSASQTVQVNVLANPEEIPEGKTPKDILWDKAEAEGLSKAINTWLRERLLIKAAPEASSQSSFLTRKGQFTPEQDAITKLFSQPFRVRVDFTASTGTSGEITSFKDGRAMGGEDFYCTIKLSGQVPDDKGAYFLVTRPEMVQNKQLMRVIGSGKIYNTVDSTAQGLLKETNRDIDVGDSIFLVSATIEPLQAAKEDAPEATESETVDEVTVEPAMEPEPMEEPAEPK